MEGSGDVLLAFDIGGTRVKAGLVSVLDGKVTAFEARALTRGDRDDALTTVADVGGALLGDGPAVGVAACLPGQINEGGRIASLPGKLDGMSGYNLIDFLGSRFGSPAVLVNDAVAYGIGEALSGAGQGSERVVVVTIGTGVGVTVVEDGSLGASRLFRGSTYGGHIPISERTNGPTDSNGRPDTIEALCAAVRIVELARDLGLRVDSVEEVYAAYAGSRPAAIEAIDDYRERLTRALVALAHAHAPDIIVVGGGPMTERNPVIPGIEERVNQRLFEGYQVTIKTARLGDAAALSGLLHIYRSRHAKG